MAMELAPQTTPRAATDKPRRNSSSDSPEEDRMILPG
jgi:hypothetical protein